MKNIFAPLRLFLSSDTDKNKWYPHIRRDWVIIFVGSSAIAVFFLFWHVYLYLQMTGEDFFSQTPDLKNTVSIINEREINAILADFNAKKERFDAIVQKSEYLVDPSPGNAPVSKSTKGSALLPQ